MKILQIIPYFTPKRGGDVAVVSNLSKQLARRGHTVTILTTNFEFDEKYASTLEGITIIPFPCIANIKLFLLSSGMKKWLKTRIKQYDIIHMHGFRSYQNIVVFQLAKEYNIPYVLHAHGGVPRIIEKKLLKAVYDHLYGYKVLRNAQRLIANSREEINNYLRFGADRAQIQLVYNGVDTEFFRSLPPRGLFKEKHKIAGLIILFLGRIDKTKGLGFLVRGFSRLKKETQNKTILVIAGPDNNYKKELKTIIQHENIEGRVRFIDFVDGREKLSAYVDADIFVTTASYRSGVLITPIEAILCGTPVIVTEECGEIIKEAKCGHLVAYGHVEGLTQMMEHVLENQEKEKELTERGKEYIYRNLSWERVAGDIERIYESILRIKK